MSAPLSRLTLALALALAAGAASAQTIAPPAERTYPDGSPFQAGRPLMTTRPAGDAAILRTVADAMGFIRGAGPNESLDVLNRLIWRGKGATFDAKGQRVEVTRYTYAVSLHQAAAREDIERATPAGRLVQVVRADRAWDEREPGVGGRFVDTEAKARRLRMARTALGFTRALLKAPPATVRIVDPGPAGQVTITVPIEGVATTAMLDKNYRPATITQTVGGQRYEAAYADYRDLSEYGVMFPTHIVEKLNGKTALDVTIDDGRVATYVVFPLPEPATPVAAASRR